jgi:hypothetical protein
MSGHGRAPPPPGKRSTATSIPELYSHKVATVQEAYQQAGVLVSTVCLAWTQAGSSCC